MERRYWVAVAATAATLALAACGGGTSGTAGGQLLSGGTFTMNLGTDPGTINPYETTGGTNRQIFAFSYDTLVARNSSGTVVPQLASSWTVGPNSVTYTLKKGVTCQDGSTLTPSDIADDFNYIKAPATLSPWIQLTVPVAYTVTADDSAGTFTITTAQPFGFLLEGAGSLPIVCPNGLKDPKSIEHATDGTGPYQVTQYVANDHYTFQARSGYTWGPAGATNSEPGSPKTVKIAFVQDESTSANELLSGQINAAQITGPDRSRLDPDRALKRYDIPVMVGELNLNEAPGRVLADEQVRQAMFAALDRQQITQVGTSRLGTVAKNIMAESPVACPGDETTGSLPDVSASAANQTLDADGWVKGGDGIRAKGGKQLTLNLIYQVGAPQTVSAVELIGQELKAVGIDAKLTGLTQAAFLAALYTTEDFDVYYSGINLEYPFMMTAYYGGATPAKGGRNAGSIVNPQFDSLSAQALGTAGAAGCALWSQAHEALLKRADLLPISIGDRPFYTSKATLSTVGLFAVPTSIRLYQWTYQLAEGPVAGPSAAPAAPGTARRRAASGRWVAFIGRRLVRLVISLLILVTAAFIMVHLIPGDPVVAALGDQATPQLIALRRHQLGLDQPLFSQYVHYLHSVLTGDFGESITTQAPVADVLRNRFPNTLRLALPAFVLVILVAMPVGLLTAVRTRGGRGGAVRALFVNLTGLLNSVPDFVLATLLSVAFVVTIRAFPPADDGRLHSYVLPIIALVIGPAASLSRIVRVEALKVLDAEYIRAARARRLPTLLRYWRHVLPNMMTASLTFGSMILAGLIAGTVLVENVFAWPGVGTVISQAVIQKDYPTIQGVLLVLGAAVLVLNMIVDVLLGLLDPRSRIRGQ